MKFKIFISSKNNDKLNINDVEYESLTEIRKKIKKAIEEEYFLSEKFFEIKINEEFSSDASVDSYNKCLEEVTKSDLTISLYNGSSGWAPKNHNIGICHAELVQAMEISSKKSIIIDISGYFKDLKRDKNQENRDDLFKDYVQQYGFFTNPIKLSPQDQNGDGFNKVIIASFKKTILEHFKTRIELSNVYFNIGGSGTSSLNWKKLKYSSRSEIIITILKESIKSSLDFKQFIYLCHSIPDNMSIEDAKSYTGRPFLKDQDLILKHVSETNDENGPIHFIGVYGNASEIQVKNLIGFPDISAIKSDFGIYVWEQNTHVQLIFLNECINPEAVKTKFLLFNNWCKSNGEYNNIIKRAKARFHILNSINEAKSIAMGEISAKKKNRRS